MDTVAGRVGVGGSWGSRRPWAAPLWETGGATPFQVPALPGYHPYVLRKPMASKPSDGSEIPGGPEGPQPDGALDTFALVRRAQGGDHGAREALVERCLPRLRQWAHGRLPTHARSLLETDDLVQDTLFNALQRLPTFEPRHEGALNAYLRQALLNRIRDEVRRASRRPPSVELTDGQPDSSASPLEEAIGRQALDRYESALESLAPSDREAIVARIELQCTYDEVAVALGKPTADAARVAVTRALARLLEAMNHGL
jgi:RNA polymerase sigma-70 factor, ECF subfamily